MLAESTFEMFTGPETITVSVTDRSCSAVRVTFHGKLRKSKEMRQKTYDDTPLRRRIQ